MKNTIKSFVVAALGLSVLSSAFASDRGSLELLTVKGKNSRSGIGLPVYREQGNYPQLSAWVLTQGSFNPLDVFADRKVVGDDGKLYLGGGVSFNLWSTPNDKYSLRVVGGWSADFSNFHAPKSSEWALGASLGIRF